MHSHEFLADPIQLLIFSRYLLAETRRLLASPNQYVLGFRYTQGSAEVTRTLRESNMQREVIHQLASDFARRNLCIALHDGEEPRRCRVKANIKVPTFEISFPPYITGAK